MAGSSFESGLSPRRRGWILLTAIAATVMFSWASISHLGELVELQQLPNDVHSVEAVHKPVQSKASSHLASNTGFRGDSSSVSVEDTQQVSKKSHSSSIDGSLVATNKQSALDGSISSGAQSKQQDLPKQVPQNPRTSGGKQSSMSSSYANKAAICKNGVVMEHTDFWGDALVFGNENKVDTPEACCQKCAEYKPSGPAKEALECNVWVWCGEPGLCGEHYHECWLKHLAHPTATAPSAEGPHVGWTTGLMQASTDPAALIAKRDPSEDRKYHIVISAQGPATHWQSRVHYYWYKKIKRQCEEQGDCDMGGFTRILHSGEADDLMKEIPTFVAKTLPPEHPNHGYIVLNRPWAFMQWVQEANIPEKYVLMSEPDHLWLRPMPNLMIGQNAAAYPFFYIEPSKKEYLPIVQKFVGPITRKESEQIAPIGNAPTLMSWDDLTQVVPLWFNLSIAIHNDDEASKEWGWVQEMYAFTIAAYKAGLRDIGLHLKWMSQPPFDTSDESLKPFYILHYTYGMDYTLDGVFTPGKYGEWRFDKRSYASMPPPRGLELPPEKMTNGLVRHLIEALNEATEAIPGWDSYAKTGKVTEVWDGKI